MSCEKSLQPQINLLMDLLSDSQKEIEKLRKETEAQRYLPDNSVVNGMTLRDLFAAHALSGFIAMHSHPSSISAPDVGESVRYSYRCADEMLRVRARKEWVATPPDETPPAPPRPEDLRQVRWMESCT